MISATIEMMICLYVGVIFCFSHLTKIFYNDICIMKNKRSVRERSGKNKGISESVLCGNHVKVVIILDDANIWSVSVDVNEVLFLQALSWQILWYQLRFSLQKHQ